MNSGIHDMSFCTLNGNLPLVIYILSPYLGELSLIWAIRAEL
jgi:hypothetical protein